jgi:phage shock protein A
MKEQIQTQIIQSRATAQAMGDAALEAMTRGDIGLARTAARQAAQWARVVMQLETGEKLVEPEDETPPFAAGIKV